MLNVSRYTTNAVKVCSGTGTGHLSSVISIATTNNEKDLFVVCAHTYPVKVRVTKHTVYGQTISDGQTYVIDN